MACFRSSDVKSVAVFIMRVPDLAGTLYDSNLVRSLQIFARLHVLCRIYVIFLCPNPCTFPAVFFLFLSCFQLSNMSMESGERDDDVSNLIPSAAPPRGSRRLLMTKMPSQSIKNLLDTVETPDTR